MRCAAGAGAARRSAHAQGGVDESRGRTRAASTRPIATGRRRARQAAPRFDRAVTKGGRQEFWRTRKPPRFACLEAYLRQPPIRPPLTRPSPTRTGTSGATSPKDMGRVMKRDGRRWRSSVRRQGGQRARAAEARRGLNFLQRPSAKGFETARTASHPSSLRPSSHMQRGLLCVTCRGLPRDGSDSR